MDRLSSLMTRAIGSGASVAEPTTRMRNTAEASKACGEIPQPQTSCQNVCSTKFVVSAKLKSHLKAVFKGVDHRRSNALNGLAAVSSAGHYGSGPPSIKTLNVTAVFKCG